MPASYPASIPTLATVTSNTVPSAADVNVPNAEIVAAATEFGVNPQIIDDTVSPGASPTSVAAVLDMFANIVKTNGGVSGWQKSAVPAKQVIYGHGAGGTVAGTTINYLNMFGNGINATETFARMIMTYPGNFRPEGFWVELLTAQPSDNILDFIIYKNGSVGVDAVYLVPKSSPAGVYHFPSNWKPFPSFTTNDAITLGVSNVSSSASAQIGAWSLTMTQTG